MSVLISEIARTVAAIRRAGNVDVERLSFEVSEVEWWEIVDYLRRNHSLVTDITYAESFNFMGIMVRRKASPRQEGG